MKELASQHFKVNDSDKESPQNLLKDSSTPELEPLHVRIKPSDKETIQKISDTDKFHSQASVIREIIRLGLPRLEKRVKA